MDRVSHRDNGTLLSCATDKISHDHLQATANGELTVTISSALLETGRTYSVTLRVTTIFDATAESTVQVYKSPDALPTLKVGSVVEARTCCKKC